MPVSRGQRLHQALAVVAALTCFQISSTNTQAGYWTQALDPVPGRGVGMVCAWAGGGRQASAIVPQSLLWRGEGPGPECHRQLRKQDREKLLLLDRKPITGFPKCTSVIFQKLDQDSCFSKITTVVRH